MIYDVEDGGHLAKRSVETDEQSDQPKVANGRVSE